MFNLLENTNRTKLIWRAALILLLILVLGRFLVVGKAKVLFNHHSSDGDESAYLELGLDLREAGVLSDGTRPLLYPLLLAPIAERIWPYFTGAKLITLAVGAATVLAVFLVGLALFDWETGLLAAFLLAANREFHLRASTVYADTLLVMLFVVAWFFLIRSFRRRRDCLLAGFFVGLAYMTKSSATLLLAAWGMTAVCVALGDLWGLKRLKPLLLVPAIFLLTASPLLLYNWAVFGNPVYNFATTHVMWMDRWAQSQVADPADLPTLASYLQTHDLADMAARLQKGAARLNPELALTLIPSRSFEPTWLGPLLLGLAGLLLGWLLLFQRARLWTALRRRRVGLIFSASFFALFYLFSAWYAEVLMESRFLIPVLGPFSILLAAGTIGALRALRRWLLSLPVGAGWQRAVRWSFNAGALLLLGWGVWWLVATTRVDAWSLEVDAFASDRAANAEPEQLLAWLVQDHPGPTPARVVFGPSKSLPLWKFPRRFSLERIPVEVDSWPAMEQYLAQTRPDYLILDSDTVRRRRQALGRYFSYEAAGIDFDRLPEGWPLAYLHDGPPYTWAIFTPSAAAADRLVARFDRGITLRGYDVIPPTPDDNGDRMLRVTLLWQAQAPVPEDYTIFVHLAAPDGFVKAQQDRQPFAGRWPTSRWQPDHLLADRFDIMLDESISPGDYLLLAGLYHPATGQRLPLLEGSPAPSPDAVLLDAVTIE